jgi:hypothetical protein
MYKSNPNGKQRDWQQLRQSRSRNRQSLGAGVVVLDKGQTKDIYCFYIENQQKFGKNSWFLLIFFPEAV